MRYRHSAALGVVYFQMNEVAVVLYEKGKAPAFTVFPSRYKANKFRRQNAKYQASILPVTKVSDDQPNPPHPDTAAEP
jgi:hypothetical protein